MDFRRLIVLMSAFGCISTATAETCEYKAVMTDAEIEACRHPSPADAPSAARRPASPSLEKRAGSSVPALRTSALDEPEENPTIGMSSAAVQQLLDRNQQKLMHDFNSSKLGTRMFFWTSCELPVRTTTARGVHEQWPCGQGHYLYFDDGVLTSIQD
jgi:hypothetical protein